MALASLGAIVHTLRGCGRVDYRRPLRCLSTLSPALKASLARVGDKAHATRTFTEADVLQFASLTHDSNPLHADQDFADGTRFGSRVVHGMLYGSMFGAIVGQRFPGAVYVSQSLRFRKPVMLGDSVTAEIEVSEVGAGGRVLNFDTRCLNQRGELVLEGEARVLMPKEERRRQEPKQPDKEKETEAEGLAEEHRGAHDPNTAPTVQELTPGSPEMLARAQTAAARLAERVITPQDASVLVQARGASGC